MRFQSRRHVPLRGAYAGPSYPDSGSNSITDPDSPDSYPDRFSYAYSAPGYA